MPIEEITCKIIQEILKYHYLLSKPIVHNKMECDTVFLVYFKLFHVFSIILTKGDSFQCEDVSLTFVDGHYIAKYFTHLEFVECLSLTTNDGL